MTESKLKIIQVEELTNKVMVYNEIMKQNIENEKE